jgi:hypothetical protein
MTTQLLLAIAAWVAASVALTLGFGWLAHRVIAVRRRVRSRRPPILVVPDYPDEIILAARTTEDAETRGPRPAM